MSASHETRHTGRRLLPFSQGARLTVATACTGPGTIREGLLNKVGEDDGGAIVREAFDEFNERNRWTGMYGEQS